MHSRVCVVIDLDISIHPQRPHDLDVGLTHGENTAHGVVFPHQCLDDLCVVERRCFRGFFLQEKKKLRPEQARNEKRGSNTNRTTAGGINLAISNPIGSSFGGRINVRANSSS